ncbi:acetate uptake transporter [Pseudonocardia petroleophila]|uniref:Acetate uptake transporter n=1 Tax=Pseudonocardia petroleophila TaxID=37331 RepID=A0A7G7MIV7_9PSEU|nr:acetate uptake transporter [Pseudonocardia petroleophila]QNG52718.1 acetate uptake transporter [Pseudonocardia petroleophila]
MTSAATGNGHDREFTFWRDHTTTALQPVAAPSILGLYGFAAATSIVAANLAGWYGDDTVTPLVLFPFALAFGGIAQLLAGMWAYRARDGLATAMHGMWGSFWIAYGLYQLLIALDVLPATTDPAAAVAFGFWFVALAAITWVGAAAAMAENAALTAVLVTLAAGATLLAVGSIAAAGVAETIGAYVLIASAVLAFYTASAMMLRGTFKRVVLPVGERGAPQAPGATPRHPIQYAAGEPGVKIGQ